MKLRQHVVETLVREFAKAALGSGASVEELGAATSTVLVSAFHTLGINHETRIKFFEKYSLVADEAIAAKAKADAATKN